MDVRLPKRRSVAAHCEGAEAVTVVVPSPWDPACHFEDLPSEQEFDSDDESLAEFLEAELLDCAEDAEVQTLENSSFVLPNEVLDQKEESESLLPIPCGPSFKPGDLQKLPIYSGLVGKLPAELFIHILKYLSPEDLSSVARVCRFLKQQSGEESLWRKGYCLRWGPPRMRARGVAWKQLYYDRDMLDMHEFLRNCPEEFRGCYILMQAAKRSHAPRPDQVSDDFVVVESTMAADITAWRRQRGLPEVYVGAHACSGRQCSFYQIDNVFLCEATGRAHVCDENCTETVMDPEDQQLVCTVSGRCSDRWVSPEEEDGDQCQDGAGAAGGDDGEVMRLGRAYYLGYECDDEEELRAAQRAMGCY